MISIDWDDPEREVDESLQRTTEFVVAFFGFVEHSIMTAVKAQQVQGSNQRVSKFWMLNFGFSYLLLSYFTSKVTFSMWLYIHRIFEDDTLDELNDMASTFTD